MRALTHLRPFPGACALWLVLAAVLPTGLRSQDQPDGSFGFQDGAIFKLNAQLGPLAFADLDGDERTDLLVMNNPRAQLVIYYQDPQAQGEAIEESRLRQPDGWRKQELLVTLRVSALAAADVDQDGRVDLLLLDRDGLEVRWGAAEEPFTRKERHRLDEVSSAWTGLHVHPGAQGLEIYALARRGVHRLRGLARGRTPVRQFIPCTSSSVQGMNLCDVNGDRELDLLLVLDSKEFPYEARLGVGGGHFGPSRLLAATAPSAWSLAQRDDETLLVGVDGPNGRFDVLRLETLAPAESTLFASPEIYPLDAEGVDEPRFVLADLDGDRDLDLVVTHRKTNSLLVFLNEGGVLRPMPPAPTLREPVALAAADLDGDGASELLVTSAEEQVIGAAHFRDGTLGFPAVLIHEHKPRLCTAGRFRKTDTSELAVLGGENGRELLLLERRDDSWTLPPGTTSLRIRTSADPRDLLAWDLGGDGRDELLVIVPFEPPLIFAADPQGAWQPITAPGTLEKSALGALSLTPLGDLLVASGNHCRRLRPGQQLEVAYQVNGPSVGSRIACGFEARFRLSPTSDPTPHLLLVDQGTNSVALYRTQGTQPELVQTYAGPYGSIRGGAVSDLDGDGSDEVILLDARFLAVLRPAAQQPALSSIFTHRNVRDSGRYADVAAGDLNGDGRSDLVLSDGEHNMIEIHKPGTEQQWELALSFPVFEAGGFRRERRRDLEPRAVYVQDLTSDGLDDLVIIVHDRVILYPQDKLP